MQLANALAVLALVVQVVVCSSPKKIVCYYGSWSVYRAGDGKFIIGDIDPSLCTHVIYSFVGITEQGDIRIQDEWNEINNNALNNFVSRVKMYPNAKAMVAVGGYNEGSHKFSNVMVDANTRKNFVEKAIAFLERWGFQGFDMDWEYPVQHGGRAVDKENFVILLKELREAFDLRGFVLSAAVACAPFSVDQSYDIPLISKYLDFINVMAYDLHGSWDHVTGQNAPLYASAQETTDYQKQFNVDASIQHWLARGAPAEKLILGIGMYGRTYTLGSTAATGLGAQTIGAGNGGPYTQEAGMLGYNEICEMQSQGGWTTHWDDQQKTPYMFKGNQWIGFDNERSVEIKTQYALDNGLGGAMIWSLETDDFRGKSGKKFALLSKINEVLNAAAGSQQVPETTAAPVVTVTTAAPVVTVTTAAPVVTTTAPVATTTAPVATTTAPVATTTGPVATTTGPVVTQTTAAPTPAATDAAGPCTQPGYVRDSVQCNKFYHCEIVNGIYIANAFLCAAGLYFDAAISVCNYINQVQC